MLHNILGLCGDMCSLSEMMSSLWETTTTCCRRLPREGHVWECQGTHVDGQAGDLASWVQLTSTSGDRGNDNMT